MNIDSPIINTTDISRVNTSNTENGNLIVEVGSSDIKLYANKNNYIIRHKVEASVQNNIYNITVQCPYFSNGPFLNNIYSTIGGTPSSSLSEITSLINNNTPISFTFNDNVSIILLSSTVVNGTPCICFVDNGTIVCCNIASSTVFGRIRFTNVKKYRFY